MNGLRALPGHHFWPDSLSIADTQALDGERLLTHGQVTDSYLLALAAANNGKLASFDRKLVVDAAPEGST